MNARKKNPNRTADHRQPPRPPVHVALGFANPDDESDGYEEADFEALEIAYLRVEAKRHPDAATRKALWNEGSDALDRMISRAIEKLRRYRQTR